MTMPWEIDHAETKLPGMPNFLVREVFYVGEYKADYSPISPEEISPSNSLPVSAPSWLPPWEPKT